MSHKKLAWANKEVETFVCILGEEDVVYDVYVAAAAIDIRPTTKGTVGSGNATSELSWANRSLPTAPLRSDPFRTLQWKCGIRPGPGLHWRTACKSPFTSTVSYDDNAQTGTPSFNLKLP
ncbi:unnamed protein product [Boreogadus saida]